MEKINKEFDLLKQYLMFYSSMLPLCKEFQGKRFDHKKLPTFEEFKQEKMFEPNYVDVTMINQNGEEYISCAKGLGMLRQPHVRARKFNYYYGEKYFTE